MTASCPHCHERIGGLSILRWANRTPTWYVECHACGKPLEYSRNSRLVAIWVAVIAVAFAALSLTYAVSVWLVTPIAAAAFIVPHFFVHLVPAQRFGAGQVGATVGGIKLPSLNASTTETKTK